LRAGLLSQPAVKQRINDTFVSTWILIDDAEELATGGDVFASTLAENWEYPLDLMFLSTDGELITKLNSFRDLRSAHHDVGHPPEGRGRNLPHVEVFNRLLDKHFSR
jgi:hypothetical protein